VIPCPFCGSIDLDAPHEGERHRAPSFFLSVRCRKCGAEGPPVHVQQLRLDGQPYGHDAVPPRSAEGKARWQATIDRAAREARAKWNARV
jgi:hypothetical protein